MRSAVVFLTASLLLAWPAAHGRAETISLCDAASSNDYLTKASGQFLRGTTNAAFCWFELVHQPVEEMRGGGNLLVGLGKGVGHSFLRFVKGVGDIATCVSPHQNEEGNFPSVTQDCAFGSAGLEQR